MENNDKTEDKIFHLHDTDSEDSSNEVNSPSNSPQVLSSDSEDEIIWLDDEESEPELECDIWDNDCEILNSTRKTNLIGYHSKDVMFPKLTEPPAKKGRFSLEINENLIAEDFERQFKEKWKSNETLCLKDAELIMDPFKLCVFHNYISNNEFLDKIRLYFNEIAWNKRQMDLYEFFQSESLKNSKEECLSQIYDFLNDTVRSWVSKLIGVELIKTSATCSYYSNSDFLLVHDDLQEDRMIAYVLYLTGPENWDESWGGSLQLLNADEHGHPDDVKKCIKPANNQLILFPVTNKSYHQVEEVFTMDYSRLSINGWFHVSEAPKYDVPNLEAPTKGLFSSCNIKALEIDAEIQSWINQRYLQNDIMDEVQKHIEEYSEISLENFFIESKFADITKALANKDLRWTKAGPPNRRNYFVLEEDNLPELLQQFLNVLKSVEMFSLLQRYTDLELKTENARMKYELQKWEKGSYSLLTDYNWDENEELDVVLYIGCADQKIIGGRTVFVSLDDQIQEALITIDPVENNLNLVYRDSARYTQHVSKLSTMSEFYLLICTFAECVN